MAKPGDVEIPFKQGPILRSPVVVNSKGKRQGPLKSYLLVQAQKRRHRNGEGLPAHHFQCLTISRARFSMLPEGFGCSAVLTQQEGCYATLFRSRFQLPCDSWLRLQKVQTCCGILGHPIDGENRNPEAVAMVPAAESEHMSQNWGNFSGWLAFFWDYVKTVHKGVDCFAKR